MSIDVCAGREQSPPELQPVEGLFSLTEENVLSHLVDPSTGKQFIRLADNDVHYPESSDCVSDVILPVKYTDNKDRLIELPENFVTVAQALNDTIGTLPTATTIEMAKRLFERIGEEVSILARVDRVLPESLHYKRIILIREEQSLGVRLLPPLDLQGVDDEVYSPMDYRTMLSHQLYNSCLHGASNKSQQDALPYVFKGFIDAFKWE